MKFSPRAPRGSASPAGAEGIGGLGAERGSSARSPQASNGGFVDADLSVHVALLLVQIAFGSLAVEGKLAMSPRFGVSPAALAMARILGAALFFGAALRLQGLMVRQAAPASAGPRRVAGWRDRLALAGLSVFGIVLNQALFLAGLQRTTPVSAILLVATIPVFSAAVAALSGRERLTVRSAAGIALALLGIAVLSRFAIPELGDLLVLLNAFSYAFYVVFAKGPLARHGTMSVMAWAFGWGALIFAPVGGVALVRDAPTWSPGAVALVAYIVVVPTVLAYGLNAWALRRAGPALVTIYIYLQPLIVAALAWLQLGQPLEGHALVAGLLILGGVTVVASAPRQPAPPSRPVSGSIRA